MTSCVAPHAGCSFYLEINPDMDMGEMPSVFYMRFKDELADKLTLYDLAGNELPVEIEKGHRTAVIVNGYKNLSWQYGLLEGGWLHIFYVGADKFIIMEVRDHNMILRGPCYTPENMVTKSSLICHDGGGQLINIVGEMLLADSSIECVKSPPFPFKTTSLKVEDGDVGDNCAQGAASKELASPNINISRNVSPVPPNQCTPTSCMPDGAYYSIEKYVTHYQATSYSMLLPARFAARAFPSRGSFVNVISCNSPNIRMKLRWRRGRRFEAFLSKGWMSFVHRHGLRGGSLIRFVVPRDDETLMKIDVIEA
ncbi:hypothetical protein PIB30_010158 [Stylosanthes scabra]|uniref:TF-B3 domain-containing protein n=1 Tax=Stylosanthes scabra TaxID=79078 RepID=A0ABU6Q5F9_9FABA|nr:hypothetical protein [Stylosanthes scabra]